MDAAQSEMEFGRETGTVGPGRVGSGRAAFEVKRGRRRGFRGAPPLHPRACRRANSGHPETISGHSETMSSPSHD